MEDLINQLKLKSGIQDNPDQEGLDLFAELIIQECVNAVDALNATSDAGDAIVEHFGFR